MVEEHKDMRPFDKAAFKTALREWRAALEANPPSAGRIHLFGEAHQLGDHLNKQFELWRDFYTNDGMRHLFLEYPFFTAGFLNAWMRDDGDDILKAIFEDYRYIMGDDPESVNFFRRIKNELPETVFHGTDIGHLYETTGARFLEFLRKRGQGDGERYGDGLCAAMLRFDGQYAHCQS